MIGITNSSNVIRKMIKLWLGGRFQKAAPFFQGSDVAWILKLAEQRERALYNAICPRKLESSGIAPTDSRRKRAPIAGNVF